MLKRYKNLFLYIIITLGGTACSGSSEQVKLVVDKEIHQMQRHEVINAIEDCRSVKLRPVMYYGRIKTTNSNNYIPIVVDIQCAPTSRDYK